MATAVAVLRGVPAIYATSGVAMHGASRMTVILGIGRVTAAVHGTSTQYIGQFDGKRVLGLR